MCKSASNTFCSMNFRTPTMLKLSSSRSSPTTLQTTSQTSWQSATMIKQFTVSRAPILRTSLISTSTIIRITFSWPKIIAAAKPFLISRTILLSSAKTASAKRQMSISTNVSLPKIRPLKPRFPCANISLLRKNIPPPPARFASY